MKIERYKKGRNWAVYDTDETLIAVCVYKKGARKVVETVEKARGKKQ